MGQTKDMMNNFREVDEGHQLQKAGTKTRASDRTIKKQLAPIKEWFNSKNWQPMPFQLKTWKAYLLLGVSLEVLVITALGQSVDLPADERHSKIV